MNFQCYCLCINLFTVGLLKINVKCFKNYGYRLKYLFIYFISLIHQQSYHDDESAYIVRNRMRNKHNNRSS